MSVQRASLIAAGLLVLLPLSYASAARSPAPLLTITTHDGRSAVAAFDNFDQKHLTLRVKVDKQKRDVLLGEIASITFDPPDSSTGLPVRADSLDVIALRDGNALLGVVRRMDDKNTYAILSTSDGQTMTLDNSRIREIAFGSGILDVDRREFGTGFNLVGQDIEIALGEASAADVARSSPLVSDTLVNNYLMRLGQTIAVASKRPDLQYSFALIDSRVCNAFTTGGGKVFVYRGLFEQMNNEAELAGVLAHEIGHNVGKHVAKQLSENLLMQGLVSGGGALLAGGDQKTRDALKQLGGAVTYFTSLKFSRDDEREADFLGVYNLYQLGYDPRAMVSMFETLRRVAGADPSRLEVFFQTHPSCAERIENTSAELPKLRLDHLKLDSPEFQTVKAHLLQLPWPTLKQSIAADTLRIAASSYSFYTLTLNPTSLSDYALRAHVVASGGSGNDVRVLLFDPTNFLNWKNGHTATAMYQSEVMTAVDMRAPIAQPGQYYLVIDNRFSLMTPKRVADEVFVEYKE